MSRDFNDPMKKILKNNKEINKISKDIEGLDKEMLLIKKDIDNIKKETKEINNKIDLILEILNNFTIMLLDEEQDEYGEEDIYDSDMSWLPDQDEWNNHEDDS